MRSTPITQPLSHATHSPSPFRGRIGERVRFSSHLCIILLLLPLIPFRDAFALSLGSSLLSHLSYPLAHASFLHWFFNAFGWMFLWRIASPFRLAVAYAAAVIMGYVLPCLCPSSVSVPVLGFSVIIFFFSGMILPLLRTSARIRFVLLLFASFFLPGIAFMFHLAAVLCGVVYCYCRRLRPSSDIV